jgi:hypothetical protein
MEVLGSTLYAPIGLTLGMGWTGFKQPRDRFLRIDVERLRTIQHAYPTAVAAVAPANVPASATAAFASVPTANVPLATAKTVD